MDHILRTLIEIYEPNGIDWLAWELTKKNPYTFHHILEARNGGKRIVRNGAILTRRAHDYLNYLDNRYHNVYRALNGAFLDLNRTQMPPRPDYFEEVDHILKRVR